MKRWLVGVLVLLGMVVAMAATSVYHHTGRGNAVAKPDDLYKGDRL